MIMTIVCTIISAIGAVVLVFMFGFYLGYDHGFNNGAYTRLKRKSIDELERLQDILDECLDEYGKEKA